ncbi:MULTISPECIES: ABC transporter permease [unclassified Leptolyngbya]|uniref:cell division protein FtsX n=1 Tax=unclassified Leptolyngbya TaxID=2650499 RepID=UPI0016886A71|nr:MULTISPECIES: ABC transporter permease [unclassified Leptolyngbya]MBD1912483.1 ABC transporter permease [Leptolyngbya sp. FACHB-8]MBD2156506.1 ABC transporter permease [Leptolyngbya sp. FACHB-16]
MLKLLNKSDYLLRETFLGLKRGGWMNWAAVSTVTVLLFLFGISLQASWQLEALLNQFGSQLEISVFLDTGVQADTIESVVRQYPSVTDIRITPKEQAWESLVQEMGISDIQGATAQLNGNPLVDQITVKAQEPEQVSGLAMQIGQISGVDEVLYVAEAVQRISQLNRGLNWVSLGLISMLSLTAIAVISTTIRLIVMARRREIEVMQLVGATATWIYFPFILQGITFGIVGALMAWGLITGVQEFLQGLLAQQADFIQFLANGLKLSPDKAVLLPISLLSLGSSVGLMGSLFAVRKFALR